tara:strand:- start:36 stop:215 length:180 start_codon:yes stop_codon:yes gene_type:complete
MNTITSKATTLKTKVRPQKEDLLLISYTIERVTDVLHVTEMTEKIIPDSKGYDLVVYTK